MLSLRWGGAVLLATLLTACSSTPGSPDAVPDAGLDSSGSAHDSAVAAADGGSPVDGQAPADSTSPPGDGGAVSVTCGYETPILVVTQSPGNGASTLLRLPLRFSAAASGITVTAVTQLSPGDAGTVLRTWSTASLQPPAGFSGSFTPLNETPQPSLLFTASTTSLMTETDSCKQPPWNRDGGTIHVTGTTHESGAFALDCSYGNDEGLGGLPLPFACATGIPGWLGGDGSDTPSIQPITSPVVTLLASAGLGVFNPGASAATGFVATGATITAHVNPGPMMPGVTCPMTDPAPWSLQGGMTTLWSGGGSQDTWSGPAAPGQEADANWFYQLSGGSAMAGFCVPASMNPMSCPPPMDQIVVTGMSSSGAFQWESNLFMCVVP